jgi:hypothetical protein
MAVLDPDSDVEAVDMVSGVEELRDRLEVLLGAKPDVPSTQTSSAARTNAQRREQIARAGGELMAAAFSFLGELVPGDDPTPRSRALAGRVRAQLEQCLEADSDGRPTLTVKLPDRAALDRLADTLASIMARE